MATMARKREFLLAGLLALAALPAAAKPAKRTAKANAETVKLVRLFLDTPVSKLPADRTNEFLRVDPRTLPEKLRTPYEAKKIQLLALKRVYDSKNGVARAQSPDCAKIQKGEAAVRVLRLAGFEEILESEENHLIDKTRCSEPELQCQFTLSIVEIPGNKRRKPQRRYFLYGNDVLMLIVESWRKGFSLQGSNFFGEASAFPTCR